jgi:hypothetical protein
MRSRIVAYIMTVIAVACIFRAGPDIEARHFPIIAEQMITDVRRVDFTPLIVNQSITDVRRTNDSVCYTWKFTKFRDIPLSFIGFSIFDNKGNIYDSETVDMDKNEAIRINPGIAYNPVGVQQTRHYCTSLPYVNEDLTVRGVLVYKTVFNLWPVTHFTPTIVVPKDESESK